MTAFLCPSAKTSGETILSSNFDSEFSAYTDDIRDSVVS